MNSLQKFASLDANIHNHFSLERHLGAQRRRVGIGLRHRPANLLAMVQRA